MLLINANLLTMTGADHVRGFLRISRGIIEALGPMEQCPQAERDEEILDLREKLLLPGFVDAHCHLGLSGDGLGMEADDINEESDPVTPHLRAIDGINPMDRGFAEARESGVTCAVVSPGSANPVAGQICAVKTAGRWVDRMAVAQPLAIKFAMGENPKMTYGAKAQGPYTRMAAAALIREQLHKARRYLRDTEAAEKDGELDPPEYDARCEALLPLLRREIGAHFHAHKAYDILTAVRIAQEFSLDYTLIHCTEGYLIADILAELKAKAVCGPLICSRTKPELAGMEGDNCARLMEAGVTVGIATDHPEVPIGFLACSAAIAASAGMERSAALRAVTVDAARAVGLAHRVGALAPGLDADLQVYGGDPFALGARPDMVFINGEIVI